MPTLLAPVDTLDSKFFTQIVEAAITPLMGVAPARTLSCVGNTTRRNAAAKSKHLCMLDKILGDSLNAIFLRATPALIIAARVTDRKEGGRWFPARSK